MELVLDLELRSALAMSGGSLIGGGLDRLRGLNRPGFPGGSNS